MAITLPRPTPSVTSFTATGQSTPVGLNGQFNFGLAFSGAVATVSLKRKLPGEAGYSIVTYGDGTALTFTADVNSTWVEPENDALYEWDCTAYTSGTVTARLAQ